MTGLVSPGGTPVPTPLYGYGQGGVYTWPGKTFEVTSGASTTVVNWENNLPIGPNHLLPVDTSLHWCYSLMGYDTYTIPNDGIPIIVHLHGGHSDFQYDGNPEFFFNPGASIVGPQWATVPGGFTNKFVYDNNVPAGNLWYHDHALGITRLNVYAGMAGFYFVRDGNDTGAAGNPLGLPAYPYELAYAIQDRMFLNTGELFYPAFQGDPFWVDFITPAIEANLAASGLFGTPPNLGPSALAEFFGDHMLVNGKIWPVATTGNVPGVEPRHYRMRLLNGCDSRFLAIRFRPAKSLASTDLQGAGRPIPFWVIGSDQGLAQAATQTDFLIIGPGERYDIVVDFSALTGRRVIMENIANDAPFAGNPRGSRAGTFPNRQTDRIMAFDVMLPLNNAVPDNFTSGAINFGPNVLAANAPNRQVALFEGMDEYGRLQPLLGVAVPTTDVNGSQVNGAIAWHQPTTENPGLNTTEIWEIYNTTPDAHPVHLHLVHFEIMDRQKFKADLIPQPVVQHNGAIGSGFAMANIKLQGKATPAAAVEMAPKDMVTAYPGEVTRIRATFDKAGRYVWHCHILSHEDHEMMRVLQVG
jgi:spore coat protein A